MKAQDLCKFGKNIHAIRCSLVPALPKTLVGT